MSQTGKPIIEASSCMGCQHVKREEESPAHASGRESGIAVELEGSIR